MPERDEFMVWKGIARNRHARGGRCCGHSRHGGMWPAGLAVVLLALSGCPQRAEFVAPPPPKVTVAIPLKRPVQEYFEAPGQTRPVKRVELRSRVEGYLKEIHFQDGDLVDEGQLLFVVDQAPYEAELASADATVTKAKAQLRLSDQQLTRTQSLAANQATTESNLDIHKAEQASAAADVALAEASLQQAELNVSYTQIHAPFAGRMGRHLVDVGNLVQSETTLLTTLESVDPIHAYFSVSESDLLRFRAMQREGTLKISEADPVTIELALGDTGDFQFTGKLDFREFGIDPATGTTQRRAVFPNSEGQLIPGLFVRLRAAVGDPHERLLVEERAVSADQRGEFLLIVDDKNVVQYRPVKLGLLKDGIRAIESGLKADDRVVINGLQRARPGTEVTPELAVMGAYLEEAKSEPAAQEDAQKDEDQAPAETDDKS